ncbi:MAG: Asp23/Gls24 family envelope stress response protein [Acutalibacteraceae bacterium]
MIRFETRYGEITIENSFFAEFIGNAVTSCYGVSGMVAKGTQKIRRLFTKKDYHDTGIVVTGNIDKINVDLYITVMYGVNINAISKSIVHKVKYSVEEATGIQVNKVTVHIDGMNIND